MNPTKHDCDPTMSAASGVESRNEMTSEIVHQCKQDKGTHNKTSRNVALTRDDDVCLNHSQTKQSSIYSITFRTNKTCEL